MGRPLVKGESRTINLADSAAASFLKLGEGTGEKRLYVGQRSIEDELTKFYFSGVRYFFICKSDLIKYMQIAKHEYYHPTQDYLNKLDFGDYYETQLHQIEQLPNEYYPFITAQNMDSARYYLRIEENNLHKNYEILRSICLPKYTKFRFIKYTDNQTNNSYIKMKPIFSKKMTANELGEILSKMYNEAPSPKKPQIYVFAFRFAESIAISDIKSKDIIEASRLDPSYKTELDNALSIYNLMKESNQSIDWDENVILDNSETSSQSEQKEINFEKINVLPLQQIWYGAPGTGKSHGVKELTDGLPDENVFRTTFHPDSDYSTFVGCYKPKKEQVVLRDMAGRVVLDPITNEEITEERITYEFEPQAFIKAYIKAYQTDEPVALVIEEINRGNCAQVFGDIFQLLDRKEGVSEYPVKPDSSLNDYLKAVLKDKYDESVGMIIPSNLHIWATMNTSDQSLFPIDSAFKRRWSWKYVPINTRKENWVVRMGDSDYGWSEFLEAINEEIFDTTNSEDKQLGFYFCKAKKGVIEAEIFVNKVLFYLYNDVFKDYGLDRNFLRDENGKIIPFKDFFTQEGEINTDRVKTILENLKKK